MMFMMYVFDLCSLEIRLPKNDVILIVQQKSIPSKSSVSNGEIDTNGITSVMSGGEEKKGHAACTTVFATDEYIPKSTVTTGTETAILRQQKSLRDTFSNSSGTPV